MINVNIHLHGFSTFVCTCFVPNWGSPGALGWLTWTARGRLPSDSPQEYWWLPRPQYPRKKWMKQLKRKSVVITSRDYLMLVNRIFHRDRNWSRRVTFSSVNATWKFYQSKSEIKILLLTRLMVDKECNTAEKKNRLTVDIMQSWEKFSQIITLAVRILQGVWEENNATEMHLRETMLKWWILPFVIKRSKVTFELYWKHWY